jgi:hypothetical protein
MPHPKSSSTFTPILTATPGAPPTYNVGMAETFSWIPIEGAGRPIYARASYIANPEDIKVSLSAENINVSLDQLELNTDQVEQKLDDIKCALQILIDKTDLHVGQFGFDFIEAGSSAAPPVYGNWNTITVVSACKFDYLGAENTTVGNIADYEFPCTFTFSGLLTGIKLSTGAIIAYKTKQTLPC